VERGRVEGLNNGMSGGAGRAKALNYERGGRAGLKA